MIIYYEPLAHRTSAQTKNDTDLSVHRTKQARISLFPSTAALTCSPWPKTTAALPLTHDASTEGGQYLNNQPAKGHCGDWRTNK